MLQVKNITKRFSGVTALDNISLEFLPGHVHAIIGENGAGKSTLMKILSGVYTQYEGELLYKGHQVHFSNPKEAQEKGISIIHQELNLVAGLSITENIFLGRELVTRLGLLNKTAMRQQAEALLGRLQLRINPDTLVGDLKVGQQQVVEIAKALLVESEVIIMDEPSSAISESETAVLFDIIAGLKRDNKAIVYISHKLDELFKIADRYIVLRDGKLIEEGPMEGMQQELLIQKMVGRDIQVLRRQAAGTNSETIFSVERLSLPRPGKAGSFIVQDISFNVGKGEILGIFGLMGAGRTELLETIFGLHARRMTGTIKIKQQPVSFKSPYDAKKAGLALVPEDRKKDGLVPGLDVQTNIGLTTLSSMQTMGWLHKRREADLAQKYIRELHIKTASGRQATKDLSGGNQQKIVLAKWLATQPVLLMLDEPTRGIDIHAKSEIYQLILQLAGQGLGIIVVSSELPEILAIADRVLVMCEGKIKASLPIHEAAEEVLLKAAIPLTI
jgi:ribose transport system ATP-binding protein